MWCFRLELVLFGDAKQRGMVGGGVVGGTIYI